MEQKGFREGCPDLAKAAAAFESFAQIGFDCANDIYLMETGVFDFAGEEKFYFCLVRQFEIEGEDEYWQLHLDLLYPSDAAPREYSSAWSNEFDGIASFFNHVRRTSVFPLLAGHTDAICSIWLDET